jgi:hypothetical protein
VYELRIAAQREPRLPVRLVRTTAPAPSYRLIASDRGLPWARYAREIDIEAAIEIDVARLVKA